MHFATGHCACSCGGCEDSDRGSWERHIEVIFSGPEFVGSEASIGLEFGVSQGD